MAVRDVLLKEEGSVPYAYQDHLGIWTIGAGFQIDKDHGGRLPDEVRDFWLDFLIERCKADLDRNLSWWRGRPDWVQEGLILMCYQLGISGLLGFSKMLAAIHAGDYGTARQEALDSAWARDQTPARAARTAMLYSDKQPEETATV